MELPFRLMICLAVAGYVRAELSGSAARVLGQPDFSRNGINQLNGNEMAAPNSVAVLTGGAVAVSDARNHRVLIWQDLSAKANGAAPDLVLGQVDSRRGTPLGTGGKGFNTPGGLAPQPVTGNLFVCDVGSHRVLRFRQPLTAGSSLEPAGVIGQANFDQRGPNTGGASPRTFREPRALTFDSLGNLWVADTGNNRVLRFTAANLEQTQPAADLVLGQADLTSVAANRGQGQPSATSLDAPWSLRFDAGGRLYVADARNNRVLRFDPPFASGQAAAAVIGQSVMNSRALPPVTTQSSMLGPSGLAVDASGTLYVAVSGDSRILVFPSGSTGVAPAREVLGQPDFSSTVANAPGGGAASDASLAFPAGIDVDSSGSLYVADAGNNRLLVYAARARAASAVFGQPDFTSHGPNQVKESSLDTPFDVKIDYSRAPFPLYVSDVANNRVLCWRDGARFRTGAQADFAIGQPSLRTALPNYDGGLPSKRSLNGPRGIGVDADGNLWVADTGNHRVLRFPRPVDAAPVEADIVLGQADFVTAESSAASATTLRDPAGLTIGPDGSLFVADAGFHRVLHFPAPLVTRAAARRVFGQPDLSTGASRPSASAQAFSGPQAVALDAIGNLYVADTGWNRVLAFRNAAEAPVAGSTPIIVLGQTDFVTGGAAAGASRLRQPAGVSIDRNGRILVADYGNHRVVIYPFLIQLSPAGSPAEAVLGQQTLTAANANYNSRDGLATAEGMALPTGVWVDRNDTVFVAEAGNHRLTQFVNRLSAMNFGNPQPGIAVAPGSIASIAGSWNLEETLVNSAPLPREAGGRAIFVGDAAAPVLSIGPARAVVQVPLALEAGFHPVIARDATTGEVHAAGTVTVAPFAPALFTTTQDGKGAGAILNADGSANSAANPAARNSVITLSGTGQGPAVSEVADGEDPPEVATLANPTTDGVRCLTDQPAVCVAIGSTFGEIQFSGLKPGSPGVWQIRVKVPGNAATGNATGLRAVIGGVPSNLVTVAIKP